VKYALVIVLGLLCWAAPAKAQFVVIDPASIAQEVKTYTLQFSQYALQTKQWIQQELSWVEDVRQTALLVEQYATMGETLFNFVHNPDLGTTMALLNMLGLGSSLPIDPYSMMSLVNGFNSMGSGGFSISGINGMLSSISNFAGTSYNTNHIYSPNDGSWNSNQLNASAASIAGTQGAVLAVYTDLQRHMAALQALRDKAALTPNMADRADLLAQIQIEQTWINNEGAQLNSMMGQYQLTAASRVQRDDEQLSQSMNRQIEEARAAGIIQ
jgi:hypothetical protein